MKKTTGTLGFYSAVMLVLFSCYLVAINMGIESTIKVEASPRIDLFIMAGLGILLGSTTAVLISKEAIRTEYDKLEEEKKRLAQKITHFQN